MIVYRDRRTFGRPSFVSTFIFFCFIIYVSTFKKRCFVWTNVLVLAFVINVYPIATYSFSIMCYVHSGDEQEYAMIFWEKLFSCEAIPRISERVGLEVCLLT